MAEQQTFKIKPSKTFLPGTSSITHVVGKEKNNLFSQGNEIEVTKEQMITIAKNGWIQKEILPPKKSEDKDGK